MVSVDPQLKTTTEKKQQHSNAFRLLWDSLSLVQVRKIYDYVIQYKIRCTDTMSTHVGVAAVVVPEL